MSIFSDYKVGALSDEEFKSECARMNRQDRAERERESYDHDCYNDREYEDDDDEEWDQSCLLKNCLGLWCNWQHSGLQNRGFQIVAGRACYQEGDGYESINYRI